VPRRSSTYGAGTVQHLGGDRYRLFFSVGRDPVTGKPKRKTPTIRATSARDARQQLAKLASAEQGRRDAETLGAVIAEYLELAATNGMSPTTKAENEGAVARYITPHLLGMRLRDLTARHLDQLYAHLLRRGGVCNRRGLDEHGDPKRCKKTPCKHGGGDPLAPATVDRLHTVIEAALSQAVRWDYIAVNVARKTRPIEVVTDEVEVPPSEDLVVLLAALDELTLDGHGIDGGSPLPDFVALDLATGCRPGELCALRWSAVDLDRTDGDGNRYGVITVAKSITRARGGAVEKSTKNNRVRRFTISAEVVELLEARRARWREAALAAGIPLEDMVVFPSKKRPERPWRPDSIGKELRRIRDAHGLSKLITFRNLRHLCASLLAAEGVDVVTVAKRMGHSPQMLLKVYAHLFEAPDLVAAGILGRQATGR
jgi:integrase